MVAGLARRHGRGDPAVEQALGALRVSGQTFAEAIGLPIPARDLRRHARAHGARQLPRAARKPAAGPPSSPTGPATCAGPSPRASAFRRRRPSYSAGSPAATARASSIRICGALLAEWVAAQGSNFLVKGGSVEEGIGQVQPYAEGPLPADLGPDLTGLIEVAKHVKAGCSGGADPRPARAAVEQSGLRCVRVHAGDHLGREGRATARHPGAAVPRDRRPARSSGAISSSVRVARSPRAAASRRATPPSRRIVPRANEAMKAARPPGRSRRSRRAVGRRRRLDRTELDRARWNAGIGQAPRDGARGKPPPECAQTGLTPLIDALEDGRVALTATERRSRPPMRAGGSTASSADDRCCGASSRAARGRDRALSRRRRAGRANSAKQVVRARLGGGSPGPTAFGSRSGMGHAWRAR